MAYLPFQWWQAFVEVSGGENEGVCGGNNLLDGEGYLSGIRKIDGDSDLGDDGFKG